MSLPSAGRPATTLDDQPLERNARFVWGQTPHGASARLLLVLPLLALSLALAVQLTDPATAAMILGVGIVLASLVLAGKRSVGILLLLYFVPLIGFSRSYALIGFSPVYLPDVLIATAMLLGLPRWWPALGRIQLRLFAALAFVLALLAAQAVYRGYLAGYPPALKGAALALYPLFGVGLAAWLSAHSDALPTAARWILPVVTPGLVVMIALNQEVVPAAYGLYLAIVTAFATVPGMPRRRLLMITAAVGTGVLLAASDRRGAAVTVLAALLASWLAARSWRPVRSAMTIIPRVAIVMASVFAVALLNIAPQSLPVVGGLMQRAAQTVSDPNSEAAANVGIRIEMWRYALGTSASEDPLIGVGAGHPIAIDYRGNDLSLRDTGPHNSFVGYAFYAGYPSAVLAILIFVVCLIWAWKARRDSVYGPAIFGCVVGALLTAVTNVALETPYIAGPIWAVLAAAVALRVTTGKLASAENPKPALAVQRSNARASAGGS